MVDLTLPILLLSESVSIKTEAEVPTKGGKQFSFHDEELYYGRHNSPHSNIIHKVKVL